MGAAAAAGTYPFTVTLSDSGQPRQTVPGHYTLTVLEPNSETWAVEGPGQTQTVVGTPYSGAFAVPGVTVTYAVTAGSLPPGLSLNKATGKIIGTPTERGTFVFTIVVTKVATRATKQSGATFVVYPVGTQI